MHRAQLGWTGLVTVTVRDLHGRVKERDTFRNLITDVGRNLLAEALRSPTGDVAHIRVAALGSDGTAPNAGDTTLGAEFFRKQVTEQSAGATGETLTTVYIAPQEANQQIEEIGWFAGVDADDDVADSGVLLARVLYSRLKTNDESIQIDRTDALTV